jgi:hypothetical protein
MPGIVDWRMSPLQIVDQIFDESQKSSSGNSNWALTVESFFKEKFCQVDLNEFPSLNSAPNHSLVDGQIVRFRGMIQVGLNFNTLF